MISELWLQIVKTSASKVYSLLTSLVVLSLTARWLGAAGRGEMAAALVWTNLFYICGFFSLNLVAMHEAAQGFQRETLGRLLANLSAIAVTMTVLGWLVAAILYLVHPQMFGSIRLSVLTIAFLALPFFIWEQYGNALLICVGRIDVYNRASVVAKSVVLVLVAVFFSLKLGIRSVVVATVIGQAWLSLAGTPLLIRDARPFLRIDTASLRSLFRRAIRLHPSAVATYVASYTGVLVVNRYLGNVTTGHFQLATQLIDVMLVVPYAANIVLYSRMSRAGVRGAWPEQRRVLAVTLLLMIVGALIAGLLARFVIQILAGHQFLPAVPMFRWLLIGAVTGTLSAIMTTQWIGRGMFWQISLVNVTAVAATLLLNFILTPRIGVSGAIIASIASYATTALANVWMIYRCELEWRATSVNAVPIPEI